MPSHSRHRWWGLRSVRVAVTVSLLVLGLVAVALPNLGVFLVQEDPLQPADAIFVLAGTSMERPLEAADLYQQGTAPEIILPADRLDGGQVALAARGIAFPGGGERARDALVRLGVPEEAIVLTPETHNSTASEGDTLRRLAGERHWRRVVVVTSKFHTRRAGFALRRALKGTDTEIVMRASRYDPTDVARWWRRRDDVRFALLEVQKLLLYWFGLRA